MRSARPRSTFRVVTRDTRIVHELEQFAAAMRDLAPLLARVRDTLMEHGYTREEAVEGSYRVLDALMAMDDPDQREEP